MAEYIEYHPLKFWLDPASIAEIVAHIQTYLVNNPINSTTEIETIIHDYLIAHPELLGVVSVNGETGEVVLTSDDISVEENITITDVLDSLKNALTATFCISESMRIVYNITSKVLTIPSGGFIRYNGKSRSNTSETTINLSDILENNACVLMVNDDSIYATTWTQQNISGGYFLGYIYGNCVYINGVSSNKTLVINSNGNSPIGILDTTGFIGIHQNSVVVYNYNTKTLTIPSGFYSYHGKATGKSQLTLELASVMAQDSVALFMNSSTIYGARWNGCYATNPTDQCIGYIYRKNVVLFGVPDKYITVIDDSNNSFVYCFGDSITAGVGTTKAYHMYFHDWLPAYHFKNYGIGSTGYLTTTDTRVLKGGGVEGIGSYSTETGNNTVYDVMQTISDEMPYILISAGTNDYSRSHTATDFRTAVQTTLDYAQTKTPHVFVMTPIKRVWSNGDWDEPNSQGLYLKDYADIIVEECESRGITYSNGYNVSLDPKNTVCKTNFMPDGLHPNANGHARMARNYYNRLLESMCR